jgi:hypothetical protein
VHIVSFPSADSQIDLLLRCLPRVIELLVEDGHLSVDWFAAQPGDFQPRSYRELGVLGTALLLASSAKLDDQRELRQLMGTWITDALVDRGRKLMRTTPRAPTAVELRDMGVSEDEVAKASPRTSRPRLSARLSRANTTFRDTYQACIVEASEHAAAILAAESHQAAMERDQQRAHDARLRTRHDQAG